MSKPDFTLYHFPASYYSQKVLCTLCEKGVPFKERLVYFHFGEHHEDWFLNLSPKGKVPVLQDGDQVVAESEEIINYIDRKCPGDSPLVPDLGTKLGQDVDKYRKLLDIDIETISFGILKNASLRSNNMAFPAALTKRMSREMTEKHMNEKEVAHQQQIDKVTSEEVRKEYEERLKMLKKRNIVTSDEKKLAKVLDEQEKLFDELEAQLQRMKQSCQSDDYWLCGRTFTAADITATTLMVRFCMLGIDERYCNPKRPLVCEYKRRLLERPTGKKVWEQSDRGAWLHGKRFIRNFVAKCALRAGLVIGAVGVGVFVYRRYLR